MKISLHAHTNTAHHHCSIYILNINDDVVMICLNHILPDDVTTLLLQEFL